METLTYVPRPVSIEAVIVPAPRPDEPIGIEVSDEIYDAKMFGETNLIPEDFFLQGLIRNHAERLVASGDPNGEDEARGFLNGYASLSEAQRAKKVQQLADDHDRLMATSTPEQYFLSEMYEIPIQRPAQIVEDTQPIESEETTCTKQTFPWYTESTWKHDYDAEEDFYRRQLEDPDQREALLLLTELNLRGNRVAKGLTAHEINRVVKTEMKRLRGESSEVAARFVSDIMREVRMLAMARTKNLKNIEDIL